MCHGFPLLLITRFRPFSPIFCLLAFLVQTGDPTIYDHYSFLPQLPSVVCISWTWCYLGSDWLAELVEVQNGGSHNVYGLNYSWFRGNGKNTENKENTHWLKGRSKLGHLRRRVHPKTKRWCHFCR